MLAVTLDQLIPSEVKFKALYGMKNFHTSEDAYDDDEMKTECRRLTGVNQQSQLKAQLKTVDIARQDMVDNMQNMQDNKDKPKSKSLSAVIETDSDESEPDSDGIYSDSESSTEASVEIAEQFLRFYTKTHRMSGVTFKTIILFSGRVSNLFKNPNEYFEADTAEGALSELFLHFRCKDTYSKITHNLSFTGPELLGWLSSIPGHPKLDFSTKYRRAKFGEFLLRNLCMRYSIRGDFILDLINEEIGQLTSQAEGMADFGLIVLVTKEGKAREEARAEAAENKRERKAEKKREKLAKLEAQQAKMIEDQRLLDEEREKKISAAGQASASMANMASNATAALSNMFSWGSKKK